MVNRCAQPQRQSARRGRCGTVPAVWRDFEPGMQRGLGHFSVTKRLRLSLLQHVYPILLRLCRAAKTVRAALRSGGRRSVSMRLWQRLPHPPWDKWPDASARHRQILVPTGPVTSCPFCASFRPVGDRPQELARAYSVDQTRRDNPILQGISVLNAHAELARGCPCWPAFGIRGYHFSYSLMSTAVDIRLFATGTAPIVREYGLGQSSRPVAQA